MHRTPTLPTMADAVAFVEAHGSASQKQDIRKARAICALHGLEGPDFATFRADIPTYEKRIPKLSGPMPALQQLIHAAGISVDTYRQGWRAGRRLIATLNGKTAEKAERKAREDEWEKLMRRLEILTEAGLVGNHISASLAFLIDRCRTYRISPRDLNVDHVTMFNNAATRHEWGKLRKGLKAIDKLREIARLGDLLPNATLSPPPQDGRNAAQLPEHLEAEIKIWIARGAREQVDDARYEKHAEVFSESTQARYRAALRLYLRTLWEAGVDLNRKVALADLFRDAHADTVIERWVAGVDQSVLTCFTYFRTLSVLLDRNGHPEEAAYLAGLSKFVPMLKQGRAAARMMSPAVGRWCRALLADPQKTALFQIQHIQYYRLGMQAQAQARATKLDLHSISKPGGMATVPANKQSAAKSLLRRVRLLGMLAAYTAIALEAAPYRRGNMLTMRHTGPRKTFFSHLSAPDPYVTIKFPNEELKNGKSLTKRGEELEPVTLKQSDTGDYGIEILRWYLSDIRPLFPSAEKTHCLFPPIQDADTPETGFNFGTFYIWLAEGSAEIGLPMNSHNFRHGYCSIDINQGRRSMEDLARILGDSVDIVYRNYAWIDTQKSVANVQQDAARRRAAIMAQKRQT